MQRKQLVIFSLMEFFAFSQLQATDDLNCGPNTVRVPPCVDACPPSCVEPNPQFCIDICIQEGCVCKEGYIRTANRSSPCIPKSKCPKNETKPIECGRNEILSDCWNDCVTACNRRGPIFCPLERCGTVGCFCAEGYIRLDWRNPKSPCIPKSKCPCDTGREK